MIREDETRPSTRHLMQAVSCVRGARMCCAHRPKHCCLHPFVRPLMRSSPHSRQVALNLPPKLPSHPAACVYTVGEDDPRTQLHGQRGVRLSATATRETGSSQGRQQPLAVRGSMLGAYQVGRWSSFWMWCYSSPSGAGRHTCPLPPSPPASSGPEHYYEALRRAGQGTACLVSRCACASHPLQSFCCT
jgi:hypothetical protein